MLNNPTKVLDEDDFASDSAIYPPSQQSAKAYVDALQAYVDALLGAQDAFLFKGVIDCSANPNYPAADAGHTYKVSVAGKIGGASGVTVEAGDTLYCITDSSASGNHATVGANWVVVQQNIDGAVTGPTSTTDNEFMLADGASGKIIKGSGLSFIDEDDMASDSATAIPSQQSVKAYVDANAGGGGSLSDTDRQNILLDRIYQAKSFGSYRRVLSAIAIGFADSSGIASGSSSNYSVDTSGKRLTQTASAGSWISGGTPTMPLGGTAANINDNTSGTTATTGAIGNLTAASVASRIIAKIDYGSNQTVTKISVVNFTQSSGSGTLYGVYYSTDGTNWTQLGTDHTYSGVSLSFDETGSVTARYIALVAPAVNFATITITMADLSGFGVGSTNNMTAVTTAQTADATAANVRVLMEIDDAVSPTLDTDLTVDVSCDGGSHWTAASLSSAGRGQAGRLVVETVDQACANTGTSIQARIKTLNNKSVPIHGVSLTWD